MQYSTAQYCTHLESRLLLIMVPPLSANPRPPPSPVPYLLHPRFPIQDYQPVLNMLTFNINLLNISIIFLALLIPYLLLRHIQQARVSS